MSLNSPKRRTPSCRQRSMKPEDMGPNQVRSWGNSLGSSTHWVFAALIAGTFPYFAGRFGQGPIFLFFAVMMVLQLLFVWKMMPETKGVSLEEIGRKMSV